MADFPDRATFLVDTYATLGGVDAAIEVIRQLGGAEGFAVRLDSADELTRATRRRLDEAGLDHVRIVVSGGLDEHDLARLRASGAPIDMASVGTKMEVSDDAPSLDTAYKLVEALGRPVRKLSEGKATMPGPKQVRRRKPIDEDLLGTRNEPGPVGFTPLLVEVMRRGTRLAAPGTIDEARERLARDLEALPPGALDLSSLRRRRSGSLIAWRTSPRRSVGRSVGPVAEQGQGRCRVECTFGPLPCRTRRGPCAKRGSLVVIDVGLGEGVAPRCTIHASSSAVPMRSLARMAKAAAARKSRARGNRRSST